MLFHRYYNIQSCSDNCNVIVFVWHYCAHAHNSNSLVENEAFHLRVGGLRPIYIFLLDVADIDCQFAVLETFVIVGYPSPERGAHWRARGGTEGKCSDYSGERGGARPGRTGTFSLRKRGTIFFMLVYCMLKDNSNFQTANSTSTLPTFFLKLNPCQSWSLNLIFPYVWDMKAHEITDYITTRKIWHT